MNEDVQQEINLSQCSNPEKQELTFKNQRPMTSKYLRSVYPRV